MSIVAGGIMVGASVLCLGGAVRGRSLLGIIAALVMLAAMVDHAFFLVVSPLVWAAALVAAGLVLGAVLRAQLRAPEAPRADQAVDHARRAAVCGVAVTSALAYPMMAWLMLAGGHAGHAGHGVVTGGSVSHAGHGSSILVSSAPTITAVALTLALVWFGTRAMKNREWGGAVEAGGMAAMLVAMVAM